jgi:predicted transcriptional regulator
MKSILMSIQPKWCEIIVEHSYYRDDAFGGVKKLEVRKTKPKVKLPLDVYIYCCEPHKKAYRQTGQFDENGKPIYKNLPSGKTGYYIYNGGHAYPPYNRPCSNGKVFAKFTLNEVVDIDYRTIKSDYDYVPLTGIYKKDAVKYANGKRLFGWRIDDLVIFDKPKELGEFETYDYKIAQDVRQPCPYKKLTRPPQSWQYVETPDWAERLNLCNPNQPQSKGKQE